MKQLDPGKSILDAFPVEITILIAKYMTRSTRNNFSRCSVLCYQLCFALRFKPEIILTPDSISLFQNGGLCEPVRRSIRSIRFQSPFFLNPKISKSEPTHIVNFADFPDHSFESFITQLRTYTAFVGLFPNIRELYVYYYVPFACEFNVYAAILRSICMPGSPTRDTLQRLEIQFQKNPAPNIDGPFAYILRGFVAAIWWLFSWSKSTATPAPVSYEDLYSALSSENRNFLGKEEINGHNHGLKELVPKLSSLRVARISAYRLATPLDDDRIGIFERSRFYSASLATAPKLDTLYVRSEALREFQDKVEACQMDRLDERFSTRLHEGLSLAEYLSIAHARPGIPEHEIDVQFDRRAGSTSLHYVDIDCDTPTPSGSPLRSQVESDRNSKANDPKFGKLGRSISPQQLKVFAENLDEIWPDHFPIVEVGGMKCRDKVDVWEGRPELLRTFFSVRRAGNSKRGDLEVKGANTYASYGEYRNRYIDPDYVENPAAYVCRVVIIYGLIVVLSKVVSIRLETYFMV
ncbi:hypothetical protein TWF281_000848 [Arthrobotrys megalospora]